MVQLQYPLTLPYAANVGMLYTQFSLKTEALRSFEQSINKQTTRGSHNGAVEDSVFLENATASLGDQYPSLRKKLAPFL